MPSGPFKNTILKHLDAECIGRLQLRFLDLPVLRELEGPGNTIDHVFFIEDGIGSMTTMFENGAQVETSMFGFESVIGISGLMGVKHSLNRIFMQLAGHGYSSPLRAAKAEFQRGGIFQHLALRYVQMQLTLSTQNAACNSTHNYEQRLARWLLICCDRAQSQHLQMDQEFVSQMLGSTRSTVSIAAGRLKAKGLLDYSRGAIRVLDVRGLEAETCECYRVVRQHLESFTSFDTGFAI
jgi:CRP-like cAMP-binding protein